MNHTLTISEGKAAIEVSSKDFVITRGVDDETYGLVNREGLNDIDKITCLIVVSEEEVKTLRSNGFEFVEVQKD